MRESTAACAGPSEDREEVTVEGTAPDDYVKTFKWDQAKYPPRRPLQETVQTITETVQKLEDDLKVGWPPGLQLVPSSRHLQCLVCRGG